MKVFVYGTLKRGGKNFGGTYLSDDSVSGYILHPNITGEYPGMIFTGNADDKVSGEVWDFDTATFEKIKEYETEIYKIAKIKTNGKIECVTFLIDDFSDFVTNKTLNVW